MSGHFWFQSVVGAAKIININSKT